MIKKTITSATLALLLSACASHEFKLDTEYTLELKENEIYSLKSAEVLTYDSLVKEVEHYPVIFVGDRHNTEATHEFLRDFLDALSAKGYNLHFANEWFTPEDNALLLQYTNNEINATQLKEKKEWDKFSKYKWELDAMLYESIKKSNGHIYGVNIPKEDRKKISLRKTDTMSKKEKFFYDDLDLNVSAHKSLVNPFFKHCEMMPQVGKEECSQRMYRVQVTWDTYMANESVKIANKVLKGPKDKLIVFAGGMHMAYGLGIPLRFSRQSNLPFYIITNQDYVKNEAVKVDAQVSDTVFLYKYNNDN